MGILPYLVKGDYLFGRTIGIVDDENAKPLWIISGIWKTNLSNQTQDAIYIINIDSNKIDNHFGNDPMYGLPLEEGERYKKNS